MTQKLFCLCAAAALLCVFTTANVASAQKPTAAGCPCESAAAAPCPHVACPIAPWCTSGCPLPVAYRVGPLGAIRPVVYAPVYRPVYVPPRYVCPPPYISYRPMYVPYCW
jgi:hypothetical protein